MKVPQAIKSYQDYHRINSKKNTLKNYDFLFTRCSDEFSDRELESITSDDILRFLTRLTNGTKQTTKRNRYSSLKAFFNYVRNTIDYEIQNPCDTPDFIHDKTLDKRYLLCSVMLVTFRFQSGSSEKTATKRYTKQCWRINYTKLDIKSWSVNNAVAPLRI